MFTSVTPAEVLAAAREAKKNKNKKTTSHKSIGAAATAADEFALARDVSLYRKLSKYFVSQSDISIPNR